MKKMCLCVACFTAPIIYAAEPYAIDTVVVEKKDNTIFINKTADNNEAVEPSVLASEFDILLAEKQNLPPIIDKNIIEKKREINTFISTNSANLKALAKHPQWQHLLFYKNGKAEVISPDFYLTNPEPRSKSNFDPYAELRATIEQSSNESVICKYPARYLWLSHHLTDLNINLKDCLHLPDPNQEISLILVSNYLKNPASSFGHVLVKSSMTTNVEGRITEEARALSSEDLLNSSYNYGARIPANENGAMYAIKGLFGLYDAGFSETEFFKQDAVYSKNEQRDMWEYVLNLEDFDTQLLNYHLYEAKSARFDYYFIKQNCGYRSGEILELISDVKMTERIGPWYAPDYVFNQLLEHDNDTDPLVSSVHYLPSEQTQLREKFVQLPQSIQSIINRVIRTEDTAPLATLNANDRALALDFLILHRTYKISQDSTPQQQAFKNRLLSQRFALPARNDLAKLVVPNKESPALSNRTTQTKVMLSDDRAEVALSLFVKDPLNAYTDIDKRFEAIQASLGYDFDDRKWTLTDFVFLDMQQIEDLRQPLAGEPKLSWQLKTGARTDLFTGNHHSPYAQVGMGAGAKFGQHLLGYSMVNATVHDQEHHGDIGIEFGLRVKRDKQSAELSYTASKREGRAAIALTKLTLRQQWSKNNDARIIVTHADNDVLSDLDHSTARVAWHHYW